MVDPLNVNRRSTEIPFPLFIYLFIYLFIFILFFTRSGLPTGGGGGGGADAPVAPPPGLATGLNRDNDKNVRQNVLTRLDKYTVDETCGSLARLSSICSVHVTLLLGPMHGHDSTSATAKEL